MRSKSVSGVVAVLAQDVEFVLDRRRIAALIDEQVARIRVQSHEPQRLALSPPPIMMRGRCNGCGELMVSASW